MKGFSHGSASLPELVRLEFLTVESLPDAPLWKRGPVSESFLALGMHDFRAAASYVQALPYGPNSRPNESLLLLEEGRGTCLSKHGLIARLAAELVLPVHRCEGFYPMGESLVDGVGSALAPYGLDWIPKAHCFLSCPLGFVDLTMGNCTGKKGLITEYLAILPVPPEMTAESRRALHLGFYGGFRHSYPCFASLSMDQIMEASDKCDGVMAVSCRLSKET